MIVYIVLLTNADIELPTGNYWPMCPVMSGHYL